MTALLHGTCILYQGSGVLLIGDSGVGKSDLALRLLEEGAMLVADDQVVVEYRDGQLIATSPTALKGKMEVRGVGVVDVPYHAECSLDLVVQLTQQEPERMPQMATHSVEDIALPKITLHPFHISAPAKLRMALYAMQNSRVNERFYAA